MLGVAAIAAIGSLGAAVDAGIRADARDLLGGDVEARLLTARRARPSGAFLAASGTLSEIASCARWRARSTASGAP